MVPASMHTTEDLHLLPSAGLQLLPEELCSVCVKERIPNVSMSGYPHYLCQACVGCIIEHLALLPPMAYRTSSFLLSLKDSLADIQPDMQSSTDTVDRVKGRPGSAHVKSALQSHEG